jgi:diguanylate cyclase (GGDEF)-like protein/PAS domain S-box-containing protein
MASEHILPVLYDLTLTISGETEFKPLLTRFLQRMLYHTSFPAGGFFLDLSPVDQGDGAVEATLGAVVGDYELLEREGQAMRLPAALLYGDIVREEKGGALLEQLGNGRYSSFLRLPVQGVGVILLLAPVIPKTELPLLHMFQPVLARLSNAVRLCRESEARLTKLLDASHNLEAQRYLLASVFDSMHAGVMITDEGGNIIATNPAFTRITGYSHDEVAGRNPRLLSSGRHDLAFYHAMWRSIAEHGYWQGEIWNRRKNGEIFPEWLSITKVRDEGSHEAHYVAVFSDITQQKAAQQKIEHMAHYDQLTGLPNRMLLQDRFERAVAYARREREKLALLFVDLDNFKYINDVFGHAMGDRVLRIVAHRLRDWLRVTDVLSRHGGDEFVVILTGIKDPGAVALAAEKIVQLMREPIEVDGKVFHIGASVGISLYPSDAEDFDALLSQADMAMYHSKATGRDAYHFFTESMNQLMRERLDIEHRLRNALEAGEFQLYYQPLIEFSSRRIVGAEALLRWPSATSNMVSPARFIPAAEENGLIVPLGEWVLQQACLCAQKWRENGMQEMVVSVNLSAAQLRRGDIVETVRNALLLSGLPAGCLELELTESMLIQNSDHTLEILGQLKALGVKLSLDDFGTGYSNISYLQRLQVDKLKIDQSFVRDMAVCDESAAIVRAMVEMGRSLHLTIVGEGVETEMQAGLLETLGCHYGQGYLFCRPISEQDFAELLGGKSLDGLERRIGVE